MATISILLQAYFADNNAVGNFSTDVDLEIRHGSSVHLSATRVPNDRQATYEFKLDDARIVGHPVLSDHECVDVLAIAVSLGCSQVLFSPVILTERNPPDLRTGGISLSALVGFKSGRKETLEEDEFIQLASKMLRVRSLDGFAHTNLQGALLSYREALFAVEMRSRFTHLWAAFEKCVNWEKGRSSDELDAAGAVLVGQSASDIRLLRLLNNRLKHPVQNLTQLAELNTLERLRELSKLLLTITNSATLKRLMAIQ